MSEEFQKVLFDPFTQENRNDVSETRGTGLGLAIVASWSTGWAAPSACRARSGGGRPSS
jgi:signal transduction histidine kinase